MADYYSSPRWSNEVADCSMPMTFDTYSNCSYGCLYCFSQFQRAVGGAKEDYLSKHVKPVSVKRVKKIFTEPDSSQFGEYIKARKVMQWGGLSDQFDEFERKHGVTLELLRFFREIDYPLCFSTKSTWWLDDHADYFDKTGKLVVPAKTLDSVLSYIQSSTPDAIGKSALFVETTLCAYRKHFKGTRYVGYYVDRVLQELVETIKNFPQHKNALNVLYDARAAVIPTRHLGELCGWRGVRKKLCKHYIETGDWHV